MVEINSRLKRIARELCFEAQTMQEIQEEQFQAAITKTKEAIYTAVGFIDKYAVNIAGSCLFDDSHLSNLENLLRKEIQQTDESKREAARLRGQINNTIELRLEFLKYYADAKAGYLRLANLSRNFHADITGVTVRGARMFGISGTSRKSGISPSDMAEADSFVTACDVIIYYLDSLSPELKKSADEMINRSSLSECLRTYDIKMNALLAKRIKPKNIVEAGRQSYKNLKSADSIEKSSKQFKLEVQLPEGDAEKYGEDY
ncbi:MAG: hypothetical protein HY438_00685 [DPANN group archaeon]|nr:hypothetical protein [DPANN group archaeon]